MFYILLNYILINKVDFFERFNLLLVKKNKFIVFLINNCIMYIFY